jgi:hypothetical protein
VHVRAARLPGSPLMVRFGRSGGSFEGARVNSFGRVVRVGLSGGSFGWVVRAGRLRAPV